ncbi:MAG: VCBS repeat-containing protein [Phycisphaerales bacterium]|nr:VCBS repeat-containing protein [Phycisphaerales bacterium]
MADRCALRLIAPSSPTLAWLAAGTASFGGGAAAQVIEFDEPAFYPLSEIQHVVVSADLNEDSGIDVVVATLEALQVYINDGGGTLTLAISIPAVPTAVQLLAVDMDGDHDVDLVWRDESFSEMVVWYNDGSGQSGETIAVPTQAQGAVDMAAADVSDDGLVDLVLAVDPPVVTALVNQGDRTFVRHDLYWHIPSHEEPMRLV